MEHIKYMNKINKKKTHHTRIKNSIDQNPHDEYWPLSNRFKKNALPHCM